MRADRFATLYVFSPLRRILEAGTRRIPILMYHSISGVSEDGRHPYYRTRTDVNTFAEHLRILHESKYEAISLSRAVRLLQEPGGAAQKYVVITFDDGYRDFLTDAFPILDRYRYTATVFLPTAFIGETTQLFNGTSCLTWDEIRQLRSAGIEFGSHTDTHPQLRTLPLDQVRHEVLSSKDKIESKLGTRAATFAYPYAFPEADKEFKRQLRDMLEAGGYETGVCTSIGTASESSDRLFLERLPINSCDDEPLFRAKLEGGYDWLGAFQYAKKMK